MKTTLKALTAVVVFYGALLGAQPAGAVIIDLTSPTTVGLDTPAGTALISTDFTKAAGSGSFSSFLRIEAKTVEQGYNTSAPNVLNNKPDGFTKDIRLSDLAVVGDYYSFVIDVNESNGGNAPLITLNALKIFTSSTGGQSTTSIESLGTKRFDLDLDENGNFLDNQIRYQDGNSGSGQADMALLIPISAFAGAAPDSFVILYAQFGSNSGGFDGSTDGGFEEFKIAPGIIVNLPEPTSFAPLAFVLGAAIGSHRLRRRR